MANALLHVVTEGHGHGSPAVLTHGLGDSADTWQPIIPALALEQEVISWDLRGHARSVGRPDTTYSRELAINDLISIVSSLTRPAHLVGHSLGGYLSLAVALRHPELVASLTLIATGPGYRDPEARERWNRFVDSQVDSLGIPPAVAALGYQEDAFVIDTVAALGLPTLLIVGERDTRFHAGMQYLADRIRGSVYVCIEGAAHHPQRTHANEVAKLINAHLVSH